jgi:hypothetical protein
MRGVDQPIEHHTGAPTGATTSFPAGPILLAFLLIAAGFAALAGGAIEPPEESRLEVGVSLLGLLASAALWAGGLRVGRAPLAWGGVALLIGFACWNALSVSWSLAPDESWLSANAAAAYAAVAALAIVTAASTADAARRAAIGLGILGVVVALYALGGKVAPGFHLGPLDLDPGGRFARLREPLDYWNALALICVMAASPCIWRAASRRAAPTERVVAVLGLALLVLTAALSYSRGALIAYAAVLAIMVGAGPRRLSRLFAGLGAPLAMGPTMLLAFGRHDLSSSEVSLSERADDGALLGIVIVISLALLALISRTLIRREPRIHWGPRQARRTWLALAAIAACLLLAGIGALALSERGLTGEVSHRISQFQRPESRLPNTPDRLISANGNNRYVWWQEALGAFWDNPVRGTGAGSFPVVHYLYRRYEAPVGSSHSLPLAFLSETGLVGAALGIGGLALLAGSAGSRVRRSAGAERSARLTLLAAFAAWLVNSLYDWHWEIPGVTVPALIAVGVAAAPSHHAAGRRLGARRTTLAAAGAIVIAGSLAVSALLPALSEDARLQALEKASAGEPLRKAAADAERATELNPFSADARFTAASIAAGRGRHLESLGELTEAARSQPDNWEAWKRLFFAYTFLGYRQRAADSYFEWARTDPLAVSEQLPMTAGQIFSLRYPPSASATAFGTPPP